VCRRLIWFVELPAAGLSVRRASCFLVVVLCFGSVCVNFRVLRFIELFHQAVAVAEIALPVDGQFVPVCSQNAPLPTEFLASTRM